jgi:hypothetical protein
MPAHLTAQAERTDEIDVKDLAELSIGEVLGVAHPRDPGRVHQAVDTSMTPQ